MSLQRQSLHSLLLCSLATGAFPVRNTTSFFGNEGFIIVPQLLPPSLVELGRLEIINHLAQDGERYEKLMGGGKDGGWYIPDFPSVPELGGFSSALLRLPLLHQHLAQEHGNNYRLLARSEIYIDMLGGWHSDGLSGALSLFYNDLDMLQQQCARRGQNRTLESKDARLASYCEKRFPKSQVYGAATLQNERQHITTVATYLYDHRGDDLGLQIKPGTHLKYFPGSHLNRTATHGRQLAAEPSVVKLKTSPGDAVLFDARASHTEVSQEHRPST